MVRFGESTMAPQVSEIRVLFGYQFALLVSMCPSAVRSTRYALCGTTLLATAQWSFPTRSRVPNKGREKVEAAVDKGAEWVSGEDRWR